MLRENGDAASTGSLQLLFSARNDKNVKNPAATIVLQPVFLFILSFVYCCVRWVVSALLMNKVITTLCSQYSFFFQSQCTLIYFFQMAKNILMQEFTGNLTLQTTTASIHIIATRIGKAVALVPNLDEIFQNSVT